MKIIKVASFFSGCGGLDLGLEGGFHIKGVSIRNKSFIQKTDQSQGIVLLKKTGFKTVLACDIKKSAKQCWVGYFRRDDIFQTESIVTLVKKVKKGDFIFPDVDVVTGGFPCQDFSIAGKRNGFFSHKSHINEKMLINIPTAESRGMLYYWLREAISIINPKIFIAENVKGLTSMSGVKEIITDDFRNINGGYFLLDPQILQAADYGVPQSRERVFFIGIRRDLLNKTIITDLTNGSINTYPKKSHNFNDKDFVESFEYLKDLPEPHQALDLSQKKYSKAKWFGNHCQGQIEIDLNNVAPTIRAEHHGNIEFRRLSEIHGGKITGEYHLPERRLSVRECARLQTFPDDYELVSDIVSASEAYKLIGNAVPPLLAYHLAINLKKIFAILKYTKSEYEV